MLNATISPIPPIVPDPLEPPIPPPNVPPNVPPNIPNDPDVVPLPGLDPPPTILPPDQRAFSR